MYELYLIISDYFRVESFCCIDNIIRVIKKNEYFFRLIFLLSCKKIKERRNLLDF